MTAKPCSDEKLAAYLDGELTDEEAADIDNMLTGDEVLAKRIAALSFPLEALQLGANRMLDKAPGYELPQSKPAASRSMRFMPYAAMLLLGLGLGYLASSFITPQKPENWISAVASYQALYIEETLANASQPPEVTERVLSTFGQTHDVPVKALTDLPALNFKRAQLLGFKDSPLLQMAFTTQNGQPVALCITRVNAVDRPPKSGEYQSLPAVDWVKDGKGYILIGNMQPDAMQSAIGKIGQILG